MQSGHPVAAGGTIVVEAAVEVVRVSPRVPKKAVKNIPELNILISRLATGPGAPCTSNTGGGRTSVPSQPLARGKTCSRQDLIINETVTNPAAHLF